MKSYHPIFGVKKPNYTHHLLNRYAQRFYNVAEDYSYSWLKLSINHKRITNEITKRLYNGSQIFPVQDFSEYLQKRYGNDLIFFQQGKAIFVIRNFINIVTVYKEEHE